VLFTCTCMSPPPPPPLLSSHSQSPNSTEAPPPGYRGFGPSSQLLLEGLAGGPSVPRCWSLQPPPQLAPGEEGWAWERLT